MKIFRPNGQKIQIDNEDIEHFYSGRKWSSANGRLCRVMDTRYFHRDIMDCPKGLHVDHIDRDPLNNKRSNLRVCTPSENQRNKISKGYGVRPSAKEKKYHARIQVDKKQIHLGYFKTEEEALAAYQTARKIYFGEFA